ncbi:MAG: hypothetical protein CME63_14630 [Halobacteriovoraceae bacterium]|nr:hypothetical protein [Halobacteriovoraceae bacterium]
MSKKILVLVAHSDDEALGCGGTIAKHIRSGDHVKLIFMTNGVGSRENSSSLEIEERNSSLKKSCEILGVKDYVQLNFEDNKMDMYPLLDIIKEVSSVLKGYDPELIYTHHSSDLNVDHRITHDVCFTIFRPQPFCSVVEIRTFEVPSSTHWNTGSSFTPNLFVDIKEVKELKMKSLKCYDEEIREFPHARSYRGIESLIVFRGSTVGLEAAEAFCIERKIER